MKKHNRIWMALACLLLCMGVLLQKPVQAPDRKSVV